MSEHYDFHYQPTGSGAISGQQVLQQTEDAINELGDYVNDNVGGAMDVAQQALETAQNAEQDAQTALDTANSFSDAIQSAQQDASTALSTAQTAQTTASNANNTAIQASQDASSAVTTANNASGQVSTLSGTVTALGQRVTTAEGNIGQNASDITALTTRVGTAEGNITTLQNDVTIAQGNASSAMATAGQVKQQAFVFRYSSTALVASSTNSNTLLDNTDNLKVGDKVIDSSGVLFSVTAIDTQNSTFTIGTALVDLATDSDVVHKNGDETISGVKSFINYFLGKNLSGQTVDLNDCVDAYGGAIHYYYAVSNYTNISNKPENKPFILESKTVRYVSLTDYIYYQKIYIADYNAPPSIYTRYYRSGSASWSNWIKDTDKFVTTDTNQTISGNKTFSSINGVEPSSLGMPDLSNGIDISSYITISQPGVEDVHTSTYTPTVNGFISVCLSRNGVCGVGIEQGDMRTYAREVPRTDLTTRYAFAYLPVVQNVQVNIISCYADDIVSAKFFPCQGNV